MYKIIPRVNGMAVKACDIRRHPLVNHAHPKGRETPTLTSTVALQLVSRGPTELIEPGRFFWSNGVAHSF